MDMLTAVEKIVGMAKDSNLDAEFYRKQIAMEQSET